MSYSPTPRAISEIVGAACRAPSVHNSQPWRWVYDGSRLELWADRERQGERDPAGSRNAELSCGAALHQAVIAAAAEGWVTQVRRLPDDGRPDLLATLTFWPGERTGGYPMDLRAIFARHTDRRTPSSVPVPTRQVDALVRAGAEHGALVVPVAELVDRMLLDELRTVARLVQADRPDPSELVRWVHSTGDEGIPDSNILRGDDAGSGLQVDSRFTGGDLQDSVPPDGPPAATWLLLATSDDDPASRLRAGEALAAVLIRATRDGLDVVPFTQPVEVDATRWRIEDEVLGGKGHLQLVLRVGRPVPNRPRIPMTRRRPVGEVLDVMT